MKFALVTGASTGIGRAVVRSACERTKAIYPTCF